MEKLACILSLTLCYLVACMTPVFAASCTCKNPAWCSPVKSTVARKEVFAFRKKSNDDWKLFDWNKVTTVANFGKLDPELVCFAHSKGKRVVFAADFPVGNLTKQADRYKWVKTQVKYLLDNHLDGVNVDFEEPISPSQQTVRDGLSLLMWELYTSIKKQGAYYQVTFDPPYYPETTYRAFDYKEIAEAIDFYMIMAYDMSGGGKAWANCPLNITIQGIQKFIKEGIPASKLVLGVPWYGYNYPCVQLVGDKCHLKEVLLRGASGGNAAGRPINYVDIVEKYLPLAIGGVKYDKASMSPYFNYKDKTTGQMHQIWFDNPRSLSVKYSYAVKTGMRGIGMWTADLLDGRNTTQAAKMRAEMWGAVPQY